MTENHGKWDVISKLIGALQENSQVDNQWTGDFLN